MSQLRKLWAPWLLGTVACSAQPTTHTPIDAGILLVGDVFGGGDAKAKDAGGDAGDVQVLATEAGSANGPGGMNSPQWQAGSGQGSPGKQQAFIGDPAGGHSGQITLTL